MLRVLVQLNYKKIWINKAIIQKNIYNFVLCTNTCFMTGI